MTKEERALEALLVLAFKSMVHPSDEVINELISKYDNLSDKEKKKSKLLI